MGKRDRKRKKQRPADDEYRGGGGGLLTSMRGGFKSLAGSPGSEKSGRAKSGKKRLADLIWILVIIAIAIAIFAIRRR